MIDVQTMSCRFFSRVGLLHAFITSTYISIRNFDKIRAKIVVLLDADPSLLLLVRV
jgi:hypothetical protein